MEADFDLLHISQVNWTQWLRPYQDVLELSRDIVGTRRPDLKLPLSNPDLVLYVDGSASRDAVCNLTPLFSPQALRDFLTSPGSPIRNHHLVAALFDAILLPSDIAIRHCAAHTGAADPVSRGNDRAAAAAKAVACHPPLRHNAWFHCSLKAHTPW